MAEGDVSAILKSDDVARTIEWYRRMGFEIRSVFPESGEPTWCEVARDGVILQFLGGDTPWPGPPSFTGTLYFRPESVDALYEQIKDHTTPAWGPEVREWGARELGARSRRIFPDLHGTDLDPIGDEPARRRWIKIPRWLLGYRKAAAYSESWPGWAV